jgi:hypothetical protein
MMKKLSQHDIDAFVAAQHAEIYGYVENIPADARQRKIGDVTPPLSPDTGRAFAQFFKSSMKINSSTAKHPRRNLFS